MKKILPFVMMIIGIGFGVGGMIIKDIFFPPESPKIVYTERKPDEVGPVIEVGEITAILQGGGMVKTEIVLEGINKKSVETIESRLVFVRDSLLKILMGRSAGDINSTQGQEELKEEMLEILNEMCADSIHKVLFSSFIFSR
ncbi:MAG: flagellar basal body-associated FliL family protein [Peptococcaceae bacterium]|nr:flagellar basal body-associated FliL family protein [Peptococcaceae bacterium]